MNERRHNEGRAKGREERERMSDVLSQPAKHFPQLITGKSEVIVISHDFTSSQIIKHCCPLTPFFRGQPA